MENFIKDVFVCLKIYVFFVTGSFLFNSAYHTQRAHYSYTSIKCKLVGY